MQNTGNLNSLAERMKAKAEQEQQELEALTRQQLSALQQSLSELSKNALSTTEAAIQRQLSSLEQSVSTRCHTLSWMFARKWLQILLITVSILMGAALGGWGLFTLAGNKATALQREIAALGEQKTVMEKTVAQLQAQTWGLVLVESPQGRFIVPPMKSTLKPGWTIDKNPAWKLE